MRTLLLAVVMLLVLSAPVMGEWNETDTALLALRIIDWGQTKYMISTIPNSFQTDNGMQISPVNPGVGTEMNPLLGPHPTPTQVDNYFILLIGTDLFINYKEDHGSSYWSTIKKWWGIIQIPLEIYCVTGNLQLGYKIKF